MAERSPQVKIDIPSGRLAKIAPDVKPCHPKNGDSAQEINRIDSAAILETCFSHLVTFLIKGMDCFQE